MFKAARSLKNHVESLKNKPGAKSQLFSSVFPVNVEIMLHKVPLKADIRKRVISVVKPIRDPATTEICLFAKDAQKTSERVELGGASNVKKIIDLHKLRTHYIQYEARRQLLQSYDLFLSEDRVLLEVCKLLGTTFIRNKKYVPLTDITLSHFGLLTEQKSLRTREISSFHAYWSSYWLLNLTIVIEFVPWYDRTPVGIPIDVNIADEVAKVRDSSLFEISAGVTQSYRIGDTSFTEKELCANFLESIDQIVDLLPLKWSNVKQIALISTGCVPLPVYNNLNVPTEQIEDDLGPTGATKMKQALKTALQIAADYDSDEETEKPKKQPKKAANGTSAPKKAAEKKSTENGAAKKAESATPKESKKRSAEDEAPTSPASKKSKTSENTSATTATSTHKKDTEKSSTPKKTPAKKSAESASEEPVAKAAPTTTTATLAKAASTPSKTKSSDKEGEKATPKASSEKKSDLSKSTPSKTSEKGTPKVSESAKAMTKAAAKETPSKSPATKETKSPKEKSSSTPSGKQTKSPSSGKKH